jgi:hypothetical protein
MEGSPSPQGSIASSQLLIKYYKGSTQWYTMLNEYIRESHKPLCDLTDRVIKNEVSLKEAQKLFTAKTRATAAKIKKIATCREKVKREKQHSDESFDGIDMLLLCLKNDYEFYCGLLKHQLSGKVPPSAQKNVSYIVIKLKELEEPLDSSWLINEPSK